ncbi:MAG: hypothetical protein SFU27_00940 [Thermonemataceae bacterium]|nr:hypothetical protein [Thermonemataceae bacterium]
MSAIFHNCTKQTRPKNAPQLNYAKYADKNIYPNGSSELAVLMREMYDDTKTIQESIVLGNFPKDFREKFNYIHIAQATEESKKTEAYPMMAKAFMTNLDILYESKDLNERTKQFNIVVESCISCHRMHCPGPIKKIQKLQIP